MFDFSFFAIRGNFCLSGLQLMQNFTFSKCVDIFWEGRIFAIGSVTLIWLICETFDEI